MQIKHIYIFYISHLISHFISSLLIIIKNIFSTKKTIIHLLRDLLEVNNTILTLYYSSIFLRVLMIFGLAFRRLLATIRSGFIFMFHCLQMIPEIEKNLSMKALEEDILRSILDSEHRIGNLEELLDQNSSKFFFSLQNVEDEIIKV